MQTRLAAHAAAVAAETVNLSSAGVIRRDASRWVKGVLLIDIIIIPVPDGDEGPGTWDSTQQCTEGTGCQQREQAQIQEPLNTVVANAQQSLQIVFMQTTAVQQGGQLVQTEL